MTHLHAGSVLKLSTPRARTSWMAAALAMSVQVRLRAVRRTRRFASHAALVFVVLAGSALPIQANPIGGNSRDCSKGGSVTEHNFAGGNHHFVMHITDQKGKTLPGGTADLGNIGSGGDVTVNIPAGKFNNTNCDVINEILPPLKAKNLNGPNANAVSSTEDASATLWLESQFFDATTGTYQIESNFDFLGQNVGLGTAVRFPDLFSDTNRDGLIGVGDHLYGYVNLEEFLANGIPSFAPLQVFSIVNGQSVGLPGMRFSANPFIFDAATGWTSDALYTGEGVVWADHELTPSATPEPASLVLFGTGLLASIRVMGRRSRSKKAETRSPAAASRG